MSKTKKARIDAPAKNGFNYKPKFGLVIQCDDEAHQQTVFEQLKQLGYKAKVVVVWLLISTTLAPILTATELNESNRFLM